MEVGNKSDALSLEQKLEGGSSTPLSPEPKSGPGGDGKGKSFSPLAREMKKAAESTPPSPPENAEAKAKAEVDAKAKADADAKAFAEAEVAKREVVEAKKGGEDYEKLAKDFQSRYDTSTKEVESLKAKLAEAEKTTRAWDEDPIATLRKRRPEVIENLRASVDLDGTIAEWQKTALMEELKKKFPDGVSDGWEYDASEAYKAGTPSYQFRVATEDKRSQLLTTVSRQRQTEEAIVQEYAKQRDADLKFLKETYGFTDEQMKEKLTAFDTVHQQVAEKKLPAERHPLSLRNLFRGMFFDELVQVHTEKAVRETSAKLTGLYKSKGMVLPENAMADLTVNRTESEPPPAEEDKIPRSPLQRLMAGVAKSKAA